MAMTECGIALALSVSALAHTMDGSAILYSAERNCIDPNLLVAVAWVESAGRFDHIGGYGEVGLFQVMPSDNAVKPELSAVFAWRPTRAQLLDPRYNADYAGRMLKQIHRSAGSWRKTLALYNCGEANLHSGTCGQGRGYDYADRILALYGEWILDDKQGQKQDPPEICLSWC